MAKFFILASFLVVLMAGCHANSLQREIPYTNAINERLCENGAHSDPVARRFFACYNESITPGGRKFVECQQSLYGMLMNSEKNIGKVCKTVSKTAFPMYASCIMTKLVASGHNPAITMNRLNECQGRVMGVPRPS